MLSDADAKETLRGWKLDPDNLWKPTSHTGQARATFCDCEDGLPWDQHFRVTCARCVTDRKEDDPATVTTWSAWHWAAYHGHVGMLEWLKANSMGNVMDARDWFGRTPLMVSLARQSSGDETNASRNCSCAS